MNLRADHLTTCKAAHQPVEAGMIATTKDKYTFKVLAGSNL